MSPENLPGHRALIVLDGLGDRPHPDTGHRSPVEAARTPNLDRLVRDGRLGDVVLIGPGVAPESDAGVLALLGYDPQHDSPGRGVLEAEGVGIPLAPGDIALRLNFATIDGTGLVVDSRVGRSLATEEAKELATALTDANLLADLNIRAEVRATVGHRGVLWLHPLDGRPLSPEISNADPFYERVGGLGQARTPPEPRLRPVVPLIGGDAAERAAAAVNAFLAGAARSLAGHPTNARRALRGHKIASGLLVRNAGALPPTPLRSFSSVHGYPGAAVTEMPVERGIARLLGMTDLYVGPMGADRDASLRERAAVTRRALEEHPFVYVHLKGPDEPGHDGNARLKMEIVEALDLSFFGPFLDGLDLARHRIAITADHATPCILRGHSDDPVPLLVAGRGVVPDRTPAQKFSEASASAGSLGHRSGSQVLGLLRDLDAPV
jgi:2,3-bisphosphoglycerate-independent phosphoglycerate mutase